MNPIIRYSLNELGGDRVRVLGRTNGSLDPLTVFFSASGMEVNAKCTELWVDLHVEYKTAAPFLDIIMNGARTQRILLPQGDIRLCAVKGLAGTRANNIRILRDTQPMPDDPDLLLQITGVETDGEFLPLRNYSMKIEFIGDSITTGEGLIGETGDQDWVPCCMDSVNDYTYRTAEALGAEFRVFSMSGWGVHTSWENNNRQVIPEFYETLCGMSAEGAGAEYGAGDRWDFSRWRPDVVVINLGTNDCGAFDTPAYTDPVSGEVWKMHRTADGAMAPEDLQVFQDAVYGFLTMLRRDNPQAYLLWVYGMIGNALMPQIYAAVDKFRLNTGDLRVGALELPNTLPGEFGSRMHPGIPSHRKTAELLSKRIREIVSYE